MMTYAAATQYLYTLVDYEKTPAQTAASAYLNLHRMQEALARMQHPERSLRFAHIAGTKGKGSTAVMTAQLLRAAGRRVGLYTKPHLIDFRERIRIDDTLIPEADFAAIVTELQPIIDAMRGQPDGAPTFFETCVLIALRWFAREAVDLAVLETGMGGRLDATNVVTPLACAITTLALDHTVELGDTLAQIAGEKAGIIKPGVPVVTAPQAPEALAVLAETARAQGAPLYCVGEEVRLEPAARLADDSQHFTVIGRLGTYADLALPLLGEHQLTNAAVAIGLAECLREAGEPVTAAAIRAGLAAVSWPGRMQVLQRHPLLLLDGAHDPAAIEALLAALARHFPGQRPTVVLGFAREKDWPAMLRRLAPAARRLVLTAAATPRAVPAAALAAEARALRAPADTAPTVPDALRDTLTQARPDELIVVTGSLYVVGEALRWWQAQRG